MVARSNLILTGNDPWRLARAGLGTLVLGYCLASAAEPTHRAVLKTEFIYETAPFPSCHASTIAETPDGLVAAWFGGTAEKNPDVGIWVSRHVGGAWSAPVEVANGVEKDGRRFPTWNPVLFQVPEGPLLLFYKAGPSPSRWWGLLKTSADHGQNWSEPTRLPRNILGPIRNKPVLLADGTLLCGSSTEHFGWRVHMEMTKDWGKTWTRTRALNGRWRFGAIQPTILVHPDNRLQILCRSRQDHITECWSDDGGKRWTRMRASDMPNPSAGIDAVTLRDGRHVLIYNDTPRGRSPLSVAVSTDGKAWGKILDLENAPGSEFSYPAVIQTANGNVHVTYTWKRRRIRHVVLEAEHLR